MFYSPAPLNLFIFIWYSEQSAAQSQTTASLQTPKRLSLPLVSRTKKQTNKPTLRALGPFKMRGIQFFLRDGEGQKIISIRPTTPRPTNSPVLSRMTALPVSSHLPRRCSGAQGRSAHADFPAVRAAATARTMSGLGEVKGFARSAPARNTQLIAQKTCPLREPSAPERRCRR